MSTPITYPERPFARGSVPSFAYKVRESMDRAFFARRVLNRLTPGYELNDKVAGRVFAEQHGFAVPAYLSGPAPLAAIRFPEGRDFVLKPVHSTNAWGVRFLRLDGSRLVDRLTGEPVEPDAVRAEAVATAEKRRFRDVWVCEDLVAPGTPDLARPDDVKLYAFHGKVELILQKRVVGQQRWFRWYDGRMRPVAVGKYADLISEDLALPDWSAGLLERAARMSAAIPRPFMRIDFLAAPQDGIFGEFTPHPGNFDGFSSGWDRRLGRAWEEAEARLMLAAAAGTRATATTTAKETP